MIFLDKPKQHPACPAMGNPPWLPAPSYGKALRTLNDNPQYLMMDYIMVLNDGLMMD